MEGFQRTNLDLDETALQRLRSSGSAVERMLPAKTCRSPWSAATVPRSSVRGSMRSRVMASKWPDSASLGGRGWRRISSFRCETSLTKRIDSYSIRLFAAVAQAGSIVRAAERENIAASALSRRLADLESVFGTALLVRSPRGVALTDAGRLVFERGTRLDEELQALVRDVRNQGAELAGTVRLYANMSSIVGALPQRLRRFKEAHPHVHVSLHEADTKDVIRACLDDRADVGIGVLSDVPAGMDVWSFASDPLQVVFPVGHPLAGETVVGWAQVLDFPVIGVHQGGALDRLLHEWAEAMHRRYVPEVSVSSFDAVHRMVEAGLGIAVVPLSAVAASGGAALSLHRPLAEIWGSRALMLYALRRTPQPRAVQAMIDGLRE